MYLKTASKTWRNLKIIATQFRKIKKRNRILSEIYRTDESNNTFLIEISLNQYADFFNKWDCAPFEIREVNPNLEEYLIRSSDEIPFQYSIELDIIIPQGIREQQKEEKLLDGFRKHCTFKIYLFKNKLRKNNRQVLYSALAGFFLLGGGIIWQITSQNFLPLIFREGLIIGGWVFIWESVYLFSFGNYEIYQSYRTYKRLRNVTMVFRESENN